MPEISGNYNCRQAGVLIVAHQAGETAEVLLEDLQPILLLSAFFETFFGVGDQHRVAGLLGALEHLLGDVISVAGQLVAPLPPLYGRFADVADRGIAFVLGEKSDGELLDFLPEENDFGAQLIKQVENQIGIGDIGQFGGLVVRLKSVEDFLRLIEEVEHEGPALGFAGIGSIQPGQGLHAFNVRQFFIDVHSAEFGLIEAGLKFVELCGPCQDWIWHKGLTKNKTMKIGSELAGQHYR
jgi:hypothetical protein